VPRTAVLYARSHRRDNLARQIRELEDWCDRAGVIALETVAEVALGIRASKRCRHLLADVAAGRADLLLVRDVSRLSEDPNQLQQIISQYRHQIAISWDDRHPSRW